MELTKYSRNRFLITLADWEVPKDYADPVYNYLVHGFEPGAFFTAVFANDFVGAMSRSHPANTVHALKALTGWIQNHCPPQAWGNYSNFAMWMECGDAARRSWLEECGLIYNERQEIEMALKNESTQEPILY